MMHHLVGKRRNRSARCSRAALLLAGLVLSFGWNSARANEAGAGGAVVGWAPAKVEPADLGPAPQAPPARKASRKSGRKVSGKARAKAAAIASKGAGGSTNEVSAVPAVAAPATVSEAPGPSTPAAVEGSVHVAAEVAASADTNKRPDYVSAVQRFCSNIGPSASDARTAWQQRTLAELEKDIEDRIARLESKIGEHRDWLAKRQEFAAKAGNSLVQVVSKMKSEAAAQQVAQMEEETAAALILKLDPKVAAPLLEEMPAPKAAQLAAILAAAAGTTGRAGAKGALTPATAQAASPSAPGSPQTAAAPPSPGSKPISAPARVAVDQGKETGK